MSLFPLLLFLYVFPCFFFVFVCVFASVFVCVHLFFFNNLDAFVLPSTWLCVVIKHYFGAKVFWQCFVFVYMYVSALVCVYILYIIFSQLFIEVCLTARLLGGKYRTFGAVRRETCKKSDQTGSWLVAISQRAFDSKANYFCK